VAFGGGDARVEDDAEEKTHPKASQMRKIVDEEGNIAHADCSREDRGVKKGERVSDEGGEVEQGGEGKRRIGRGRTRWESKLGTE
jgi:hypothetical protein